MKVIFLDIDGVIQPFCNTKRIRCEADKIQQEIINKYNDASYLNINKYDIAAVYLDWEKEAIECLKTLINKTNAKIVLSTGWRYMGYENLIKLFRIHNLDQYIIDETPFYEKIEDINKHYQNILPKNEFYIFPYCRVIEILEYIRLHDITQYVILDDMDLSLLKDHFIHITEGYFNSNHLKKALEILKD